MRLSTGRWVTGDNFFGRKVELEQLESLVRDRNSVLLTGQRRVGKTSIARELGCRMKADGWTFLFADVEDATSPEEFVTEIAKATHPILRKWSRIDWSDIWLGRWVEGVSVTEFGVKFRAQVTSGNWQRRGEALFSKCAKHGKPMLFVIDELPIFLRNMLGEDDVHPPVRNFLSWFRRVVQDLEATDNPPAFIVSGSIGLEGLARRIGASDRINHLYSYRLGPWTRDECVACFRRLAQSVGLPTEEGVANEVWEKLGLGIPHHVQTFVARLHEYYKRASINKITADDVDLVYRTYLLGPPGQNDLVHYEARLRDALDDDGNTLATEILAEASVRGHFTLKAWRSLEKLYEYDIENVAKRIEETLEILAYDGYIERDTDNEGKGRYLFASNLLKDWWRTRFLNHHVPLEKRHHGQSAEQADE